MERSLHVMLGIPVWAKRFSVSASSFTCFVFPRLSFVRAGRLMMNVNVATMAPLHDRYFRTSRLHYLPLFLVLDAG